MSSASAIAAIALMLAQPARAGLPVGAHVRPRGAAGSAARLCRLRGGHSVRLSLNPSPLKRASVLPWKRYSYLSTFLTEVVDTSVQLEVIALARKALAWVWAAVRAACEVVATPERVVPFVIAKLDLARAARALRACEAEFDALQDAQQALDTLASRPGATPALREAQAANKQRVQAARAEREFARLDVQEAKLQAMCARHGQAA